jgi:hypothetical protein
MVTMGGWRTCTARAFVFCFAYGVVPMCALFSLVSGLSLCVYSFKIFLYLVKGNFALITPSVAAEQPPTNGTSASLTQANVIVASLLVAPLELAVAAAIMVLSGVVYYFYERFKKAQHIEEKEHLRVLRAEAKERLRQHHHTANGTTGNVAEDFNLVLDL